MFNVDRVNPLLKSTEHFLKLISAHLCLKAPILQNHFIVTCKIEWISMSQISRCVHGIWPGACGEVHVGVELPELWKSRFISMQ